MLKGGCYCGAVRYEAAGTPFNETSCHCTICRRTTGAPFTFESDDTPAEIDITTASLDDPAAVAPRDHIWTRSRLPWIRMADGLPEHRKARLSGNS